jgi:hypothetical protein
MTSPVDVYRESLKISVFRSNLAALLPEPPVGFPEVPYTNIIF